MLFPKFNLNGYSQKSKSSCHVSRNDAVKAQRRYPNLSDPVQILELWKCDYSSSWKLFLEVFQERVYQDLQGQLGNGHPFLEAHLVDVVQLEVLEEQQQQRRDALHDDLLVPVHVDAQLHALQDGDAGVEGKQHRGCGSREPKGPWSSPSSG